MDKKREWERERESASVHFIRFSYSGEDVFWMKYMYFDGVPKINV